MILCCLPLPIWAIYTITNMRANHSGVSDEYMYDSHYILHEDVWVIHVGCVTLGEMFTWYKHGCYSVTYAWHLCSASLGSQHRLLIGPGQQQRSCKFAEQFVPGVQIEGCVRIFLYWLRGTIFFCLIAYGTKFVIITIIILLDNHGYIFFKWVVGSDYF